MKTLLLGPDGQVGRALREALPALGEVIAIGRNRADFSASGRLAEFVLAERPDVIVNAAAYTAVDKAESEPELAARINARAPAELAEAAARTGASLIHYSTDYVFDGAKQGAYTEDDPTAPLNVYGRTKRDGEQALARSGADFLVFRTSWVHAPGGNNFIAKIIRLAGERDQLTVIDDQVGAPTSAALIAEVTARAIAARQKGSPLDPGIYHLTAAGETSWNGYARFVVDEARRRGLTLRAEAQSVLPVPSSAFAVAAQRPLNSRLSTRKLREALGMELPDWRVGVISTLEATIGELRG